MAEVSAHPLNPTGIFVEAEPHFLGLIRVRSEVCGNQMIPVTETSPHRHRRNGATLWPACKISPTRSSFAGLSVKSGRFVCSGPHEAIVHLAGQIGIHPPVRLTVLPRQATDSAIRHRVRAYLGFVPFSADAEARLTASLAELALDGLGSVELVERAEAFLLMARVVLPARAALERLVASQNRQALEALFTRIAARFSASIRAAFDRLLGNAGDSDGDTEADGRATVGKFRTPPASSMGRNRCDRTTYEICVRAGKMRADPDCGRHCDGRHGAGRELVVHDGRGTR